MGLSFLSSCIQFVALENAPGLVLVLPLVGLVYLVEIVRLIRDLAELTKTFDLVQFSARADFQEFMLSRCPPCIVPVRSVWVYIQMGTQSWCYTMNDTPLLVTRGTF